MADHLLASLVLQRYHIESSLLALHLCTKMNNITNIGLLTQNILLKLEQSSYINHQGEQSKSPSQMFCDNLLSGTWKGTATILFSSKVV